MACVVAFLSALVPHRDYPGWYDSVIKFVAEYPLFVANNANKLARCAILELYVTLTKNARGKPPSLFKRAVARWKRFDPYNDEISIEVSDSSVLHSRKKAMATADGKFDDVRRLTADDLNVPSRKIKEPEEFRSTEEDPVRNTYLFCGIQEEKTSPVINPSPPPPSLNGRVRKLTAKALAAAQGYH